MAAMGSTVNFKVTSFITPASVGGFLLMLIGVGAALASRLFAFTPDAAMVIRLSGLSAVLIGGLCLGFAWLVTSVDGRAGAGRLPWHGYPVLGFALGLLGGQLFFGESFPASAVGLVVGTAMGWRVRRAT